MQRKLSDDSKSDNSASFISYSNTKRHKPDSELLFLGDDITNNQYQSTPDTTPSSSPPTWSLPESSKRKKHDNSFTDDSVDNNESAFNSQDIINSVGTLDMSFQLFDKKIEEVVTL